MSTFRLLKSQKHHWLRLYRVWPLLSQPCKVENQLYISSEGGKDRKCD